MATNEKAGPPSNRFQPLDIDVPDKIYVCTLRKRNAPSIEFNVHLKQGDKIVATRALLDSGATGNIINRTFARKHGLQETRLAQPIHIVSVNNTTDSVTTYIEAEALISTPHGSHQENNRFYVGNIGDHDIILGTDWLVEHNPTIDWTSYKVDLNRCPTSCTTKGTTKFQE